MRRLRWRIFWVRAGRWWLPFHAWLRSWQTLIAALVAFGALYWGDHATRRNAAQLELHRCNELTGTLLTDAELIHEQMEVPASAASKAGATPFSNQPVTVPPLEDLLRGHEAEIGRLGSNGRDAILRLEMSYREAREALHDTPALQHTGDTFIINTVDKAHAFDGIAQLVEQQSSSTIQILTASTQCERTAREASRWWPGG